MGHNESLDLELREVLNRWGYTINHIKQDDILPETYRERAIQCLQLELLRQLNNKKSSIKLPKKTIDEISIIAKAQTIFMKRWYGVDVKK